MILPRLIHFEMVTTKGKLKSDPFIVTVDEDGEVVDKTPQLKREQWLGREHPKSRCRCYSAFAGGHPLDNAGPPTTAQLTTIDRWLL